jgi:hypothetical protein
MQAPPSPLHKREPILNDTIRLAPTPISDAGL